MNRRTRTGLHALCIISMLVPLIACSTPGSGHGTLPLVRAKNGLLYSGGKPTQIVLETRTLGLSPDGEARYLVIAHFRTAQGEPTSVFDGSDISWQASRGEVQWQTRMRFKDPSAIFSSRDPGNIRITVTPRIPALAPMRFMSDVTDWIHGAHFVAQSLGPHMVQLGFFPRLRQPRTLVRINGTERSTFDLAPGTSTYRDDTVHADTAYTYTLKRRTSLSSTRGVRTPKAITQQSVTSMRGVGMWLYFTNNPADGIDVDTLNPTTIVDQAVRAHLRYVELRTAYGAYWELIPTARPRIDAIIDGLAAHGIATIGWTVPRQDDFSDLSASVKTLTYHTAQGHGFAGLALDLERGDDFMGDGQTGEQAMQRYIRHVREAIGPRPLLIATIEDPALEISPPAASTYHSIARYANILQPMTYWRMMSKHPTSPHDVIRDLTTSYRALRTLAKLPISIGGQTVGEGHNGPPTPAEIRASIVQARTLGALGICFFSWDETSPQQWHAIRLSE